MLNAYIPNRKRRIHSSDINPWRTTNGDEESRGKHSCSKRNVRPYFLKKFRSRECKEISKVPKEQFQKLCQGIKLYAKKEFNKEISLPKRPNEEFFNEIKKCFFDEVMDLGLFEQDNQLYLQGVESDGDINYTVNIIETHGLQFVKNDELRNLLTDFLATFFHRGPFISFEDSVWAALIEEAAICDWDDNEELSPDEIKILCEGVEKIREQNLKEYSFLKETKDINLSKEELEDRIQRCQPLCEKDKETVQILKNGLKYLFEDCWKVESNGNCGYNNVIIDAESHFIFMDKEDELANICNLIISIVFYDDCYWEDLDLRFRIDCDGNKKYDVPYKEFLQFIDDLNNQLNSYTIQHVKSNLT